MTALTGAIRAYRYLLSPMLGPTCRFYPSCSCYAEQALQQHGALRGSYLTVRRLLRCHPWHEGGYDPVPETDHHDLITNETTDATKPVPHG
ncbi:membrane protein insertion efficiency factor YidD [Steroidobacter sp.]|uniref:membrane protein insertion efficiency factor YidD n=1 Tax=Steroidobacter sp. TaxID=1978227 RepID=UPI0032C21738